MKKIKFLLMSVLLFSIGVLSPIQTIVHAEEQPLKVSINVKGNPGDTIKIDKDSKDPTYDLNSDNQISKIGSNKNTAFSLAYSEPGNYFYVLNNQNRKINLEVYVFFNNENNLDSKMMISEKGKKINEINFESKKREDAGTGLAPDKRYLYGFSLLILGSTILLITANKRRKNNEE